MQNLSMNNSFHHLPQCQSRSTTPVPTCTFHRQFQQQQQHQRHSQLQQRNNLAQLPNPFRGLQIIQMPAIQYPCKVEGWLYIHDRDIPMGHSPRGNPPEVEWEPYFCVLNQLDQTFTAYRSEEMSFGENGLSPTEIPRIRLDGGPNSIKCLINNAKWGMNPLMEEEEDSNNTAGMASSSSNNGNGSKERDKISGDYSSSSGSSSNQRTNSNPTSPLDMDLEYPQTEKPISYPRKEKKSSENLVFAEGKTNPLNFLKEFEKCEDVKSEKDKLFKIRNFVNEKDKSEFSKLFFKSNWATAKDTFLKKYSIAFTENKKKELSFSFGTESSFRSFVKRKIEALSSYTTLTLENQLEIILIELPNEISNLFIVNEKLKAKKEEILEFCESIEDFADELKRESTTCVTPTPESMVNSEIIVTQDLELFEYNSDNSESSMSDQQENCYTTGKRRKRTTGGGIRKRLCRISENSESSASGSSCWTTSSDLHF